MLALKEDESDGLDILAVEDLLTLGLHRGGLGRGRWLMDDDLLKWQRVPIEDLGEVAADVADVAAEEPLLHVRGRLHHEKPKARQDVAEIFLLHDQL